MKNIIKILLLILSILIVSCSKEEKISVIEEENVEAQMIEAFQIGYEELINGDTLYAAKKFNEAELLFPQSQWAPKAALMAGYTYYSDNYYGDAVFEIERYLKTYPNHKNVDYAHFLLAMCYYENIVDEKRDLEPLLKAKRKFEFVMNNFPNTDFSMDAKFKLELISDKLAAKQMYIGKHYLKKEKWIAAIKRYKIVVETLKNKKVTVFDSDKFEDSWEKICKILKLDPEPRLQSNRSGKDYKKIQCIKDCSDKFKTWHRSYNSYDYLLYEQFCT